jgi:hypothetical protein
MLYNPKSKRDCEGWWDLESSKMCGEWSFIYFQKKVSEDNAFREILPYREKCLKFFAASLSH